MLDKKKVSIFGLIVVLVLGLGGYFFLSGGESKETAKETPAKTEVKKAEADKPKDTDAQQQAEAPAEQGQDATSEVTFEEVDFTEFYEAWANGPGPNTENALYELRKKYPHNEEVIKVASEYYFANSGDETSVGRPLELLKEFLDEHPNAALANALYGQYLTQEYLMKEQTDKLPEARAYGKKGVDLAHKQNRKDVTDIELVYAWTLGMSENREEGLKLFESIFTSDDIKLAHINDFVNYALTLEMSGKKDEAMKAYNWVLGLKSDSYQQPLKTDIFNAQEYTKFLVSNQQ